MDSQRPRCLCVGNPDHRELDAYCRQLACTHRVIVSANLNRLVEQLTKIDYDNPVSRFFPPDRIVVFQDHADEFPPDAVRDLQRRWPEADTSVVRGSWLDGQGPRDCSPDEVPHLSAVNGLLESASPVPPEGLPVAAIVTDDADLAEGLVAALHAMGWFGFWSRTDQHVLANPPTAVVLDIDRIPERRAAQIDRVRSQYGDVQVIGLIDFARNSEIEELESLGVDRLIPKPFEIEQLLPVFQTQPAAGDQQAMDVTVERTRARDAD